MGASPRPEEPKAAMTVSTLCRLLASIALVPALALQVAAAQNAPGWSAGLFAPGAAPRPGRTAPSVLIRNVTLLNGRDDLNREVDILLRGGTVARIGSGLSGGADLVVEGEDLWVTPGLVDLGYPVTRSAQGGGLPFVQDSLDGNDKGLRTAISGGVTRVLASLDVQGFSVGALISTLEAPVLSQMRLPGVASLLLFRCEGGLEPLRLAQAAPRRLPPILQAALEGVRGGKMPLLISCDDSETLATALEVAKAAGFPVRGVFSRESYGLAAQLASQEQCIAVPWGQRPGVQASPLTTALVDAARNRRGCAAVSSGTAGNIGHLVRLASYARGVGLNQGMEIPQQRAIGWITSNPARLVGAQDQVGTVQRGRRADIVVWSGNPFQARSRPEYVFVDGFVAQQPSQQEEPQEPEPQQQPQQPEQPEPEQQRDSFFGFPR